MLNRWIFRTVFDHEGTTQGLTFTPDSMYAVSGCTLEILNVWSMQDVVDTTKDDLCEPVASQDNSHDLGVMCVDASPVIVHEGEVVIGFDCRKWWVLIEISSCSRTIASLHTYSFCVFMNGCYFQTLLINYMYPIIILLFITNSTYFYFI